MKYAIAPAFLLLMIGLWACTLEEPVLDNPRDPYSPTYRLARPVFYGLLYTAPPRIDLAWSVSPWAQNVVWIERKIGADTVFSRLAVVPLAPNAYTDTTMVAGSVNVYRIAVFAYNGSPTYSNPRSFTP